MDQEDNTFIENKQELDFETHFKVEFSKTQYAEKNII